MEKLRTKLLMKYRLLTCKRFHVFTGHKKYEESLILSVINNGGFICFSFTNLSTNEILTFDNPSSGEYVIPLQKGEKIKLVINASRAIGSYKIAKKTIIE